MGGEVLRFGEVRDVPLADLLDLPGTASEEADLEGMAVDEARLLLGLRHAAARADRYLADGEALVLAAARRHWGLAEDAQAAGLVAAAPQAASAPTLSSALRR